ncbi:hypothetical protein IWX47DRAFT_415331 [Phyllosticta citricarpa]
MWRRRSWSCGLAPPSSRPQDARTLRRASRVNGYDKTTPYVLISNLNENPIQTESDSVSSHAHSGLSFAKLHSRLTVSSRHLVSPIPPTTVLTTTTLSIQCLLLALTIILMLLAKDIRFCKAHQTSLPGVLASPTFTLIKTAIRISLSPRRSLIHSSTLPGALIIHGLRKILRKKTLICAETLTPGTRSGISLHRAASTAYVMRQLVIIS